MSGVWEFHALPGRHLKRYLTILQASMAEGDTDLWERVWSRWEPRIEFQLDVEEGYGRQFPDVTSYPFKAYLWWYVLSWTRVEIVSEDTRQRINFIVRGEMSEGIIQPEHRDEYELLKKLIFCAESLPQPFDCLYNPDGANAVLLPADIRTILDSEKEHGLIDTYATFLENQGNSIGASDWRILLDFLKQSLESGWLVYYFETAT